MRRHGRPHFLSVRLSDSELRKYATVLKWYGLEFVDETEPITASQRFRDLLDKFTEGLQVSEVPEEQLRLFIRRPPQWKQPH